MVYKIAIKTKMLENEINPTNTTPERAYADLVTDHPGVRRTINEVARVKNLRDNSRDLSPSSQAKYSDIDSFIGVGEEKLVFRVDDYAVKILHEHQHTGFEINDQINALRIGEGIEGLEQLVAASADEGVIVTKLSKGEPLPALSSRMLMKELKSEHLEKLSLTLEKMEELDLHYDNPGNVLFDPDEGFTIVDYRHLGTREYLKDIHAKDLELKKFLHDVMSQRKITRPNTYDFHGERMTELGYRKTLGAIGLLGTTSLRYRRAKSNRS